VVDAGGAADTGVITITATDAGPPADSGPEALSDAAAPADSGPEALSDAAVAPDAIVDDAGCSWNLGSGTAQGTPPTGDNSADLAGATFGTDPFDAAQQRRTVPLTMTSPLAGLSVGNVYLTGFSGGAYLVVPVSNTGANIPCFVQTAAYSWTGANGQVLVGQAADAASTANAGTADSIYLYGSNAVVSTTFTSDTCLAPGETGYLVDVAIDPTGSVYSSVASVEIELQSSFNGSTPTAKLLPTAYDIGTCRGNRAARVLGTASGSEISVGGAGGDFGLAVFLDATGLPVRWSLFSQMQVSNLMAGNTAYFEDDFPEPAVARARIYLPFQPPDPALASMPEDVLREVRAVNASRSTRARTWQIARGLMPSAGALRSPE